MKKRKIPLRSCCVSHEQRPKKELIRVVRNKEGIVSIDKVGNAPGRGAYLTLNKDIIEQAKKTKVLDKKLEVVVPDEIYTELLSLISE